MLAAFDRQTLFETVNTHYNPFLDAVVPRINLLGEGQVIPVILLLLWLLIPGLRNLWFATTAAVCCGLSGLLVQLIKVTVHEPRPQALFRDADWLHFNGHWRELYNYSFPSGHSAGAFSMFCLLSFLLPVRFRPWGLLLFVLSMAVGYSRLYLAAHFFLDVYVGSILGVGFCLLFFGFMHRAEPAFFQEHWQRHKKRIQKKG